MVVSKSLKILGISLQSIGSIILAWRVKSILDSVVLAQQSNDINFQIILSILNREKQELPLIFGMDEQIKNAQIKGFKLLVSGFLLIIIGNILVALSIYFE